MLNSLKNWPSTTILKVDKRLQLIKSAPGHVIGAIRGHRPANKWINPNQSTDSGRPATGFSEPYHFRIKF